MSLGRIFLAIFGVAILMVVHEFGHYIAARKFGMRVETFSIGFGPTLWKKKPKGSDTTFQVGIIPFLAYVKIAGMNPFEPVSQDDKGSYLNASLWARVVTIAGGPLANYVLAFVLTLFGSIVGGRLMGDDESMRVTPMPGGSALAIGILDGDKVITIGGVAIPDWDAITANVAPHAGETIDVEVERNGQRMHFAPIVGTEGDKKGKIMVRPPMRVMSASETLWYSFILPPKFIYLNIRGVARAISGKEKVQLGGPVRIVTEVSKAVAHGPSETLQYLGIISAGLVFVNLLPIPALDGGRLMFLLYEAIARRRANEKVETKIHAVALLMFLALFVLITINDVRSVSKDDAPTSKVAPKPTAAPKPSE
jgi:regulator of sigma E protease